MRDQHRMLRLSVPHVYLRDQRRGVVDDLEPIDLDRLDPGRVQVAEVPPDDAPVAPGQPREVRVEIVAHVVDDEPCSELDVAAHSYAARRTMEQAAVSADVEEREGSAIVRGQFGGHPNGSERPGLGCRTRGACADEHGTREICAAAAEDPIPRGRTIDAEKSARVVCRVGPTRGVGPIERQGPDRAAGVLHVDVARSEPPVAFDIEQVLPRLLRPSIRRAPQLGGKIGHALDQRGEASNAVALSLPAIHSVERSTEKEAATRNGVIPSPQNGRSEPRSSTKV